MIDDYPDMPEGLKRALRNNNLVIFLGAGVSRLLGCASWEELAKNLVNRCYETEISKKRLISFRESETLRSYTDYKKTISICKNILIRKNMENKFYDEIEESLKVNPSSKKIKIYDELYNLIYGGYPDNEGFFITTNIDNHFKDKFDENSIVHNPINNKISINELKLYHLHGSMKDIGSTVLTVDKYIERYNEKKIKDFLTMMFKNYVVLFIGYGVNELELLDFLSTKVKPSNEMKHFILLPYWKNEDRIKEYDQLYYEELGINVIGYSKEEGYEHLYEVIKRWNKKIAEEPLDKVKVISDFKKDITEISKR